MGFRCLLGHDFGEPETEREREERGDEVVITVRQVRVCERCDERRVVSENKEVTALEQLLDAADPDRADGDGGGDGAGGATDLTADAVPDSSARAESNAAVGDAAAGPGGPDGAGGVAFADDGFEPPQSAAEDDGVILDDEDDADDSAERSPGEWPDTDVSYPDRPDAGPATIADDGGATDDAPVSADEEASSDAFSSQNASRSGDESESGWPSVDGEDEGFGAGRSEAGGPTDVSFGGGLTPDRDRGEGAASTGDDTAASAADEDVELIDADGADADGSESAGDDGFVRADSASVSDSGSPVGRTAFHCPACGHERPVGGSSMRAGDICPECHGGYIVERED